MNARPDAERSDHFFNVYDRPRVAYGEVPSSELHQLLCQCFPQPPQDPGEASRAPHGAPEEASRAPHGQQTSSKPSIKRALDLGCGPGRDSIALAHHGFTVTAVDLSKRGLQELERRSNAANLSGLIGTTCADVRELSIPRNTYEVIVATTVLDHIPPKDADLLWQKMVAGLTPSGFLFVEVHTTDDPGCENCTSITKNAPVSETAQWVINYFSRGQLLGLAAGTPQLRVLRYEERYEWDYTHGPEHKHAKAVLLATAVDHDPAWYGHPLAFPPQKV